MTHACPTPGQGTADEMAVQENFRRMNIDPAELENQVPEQVFG